MSEIIAPECKYYVPRKLADFPLDNPWVLNQMLLEIDERDLPLVINSWNERSHKTRALHKREVFKKSTLEICKHAAPKENAFEIYQRRPACVTHGGAVSGYERYREKLEEAAYNAGWGAAINGFNLWNGGCVGGLMKQSVDGFYDALRKYGRRPDQYAIQVVPADFVYGVNSINGLTPSNEGLNNGTDAAVIMPHFATRLELLGSRCRVAIACPGGFGTLDEITRVATDLKIGQSENSLYVLDTRTRGNRRRGFYYHLREQIREFIEHGLQKKGVFRYVAFMPTPELAFADLMPKLVRKQNTPDQQYAAYCKKYNLRPGIPMGEVQLASLIIQ